MNQEEYDRLNELVLQFKLDHNTGDRTTGEQVEQVFGDPKDMELLLGLVAVSYAKGDFATGHLTVIMIATMAYEKGRRDMMQ